MNATIEQQLSRMIEANTSEILKDWIARQEEQGRLRFNEAESRERSSLFLSLLSKAMEHGDSENTSAPPWLELRDMLADMSRQRAQQGFSPTETANFVFSLRRPI